MAQEIEKLHPLLFSVAYNMTGLVSDAEDLVQEAYLRFYEAQEKTTIQKPKGYLVQTITNLAINHYESARSQREEYPGVWLPEPVNTQETDNSLDQLDMLRYSTLVLMEKLNPYERAVFVLREALNFDYESVARFINTSEMNARKILSRAKTKLPEEAEAKDYSEKHKALMEALMKALSKGDHQALMDLFSEDITLYSDGGGEKAASMKPVVHPKHVARFLIGISRKTLQNIEVQWFKINHQPAVGIWLNDVFDGVWLLELKEGAIQTIFIQRSPYKVSISTKV